MSLAVGAVADDNALRIDLCLVGDVTASRQFPFTFMVLSLQTN